MTGESSARDRPATILVVIRDDLERLLIRHWLAAESVGVRDVPTVPAAIEAAAAGVYDAILLDLDSPEADGLMALHRLKDDPATRGIPVLVTSGQGSVDLLVEALDRGAVDFLQKPFDPAELRARLRVCLRQKSGRDLLERRAHFDALTGLANRHAMEARLDVEWSAHVRRGEPLSLALIDLDHFKRVNDRHGHVAGDEALRTTGEALRAVARTSDLIARYGGEEFVLIAPACDFPGVLNLAERAREQVASIGPGPYLLTASVGVATTDRPPGSTARGPDSARSLLTLADQALYRAKAAGRNAVWAWDPTSDRPTPAFAAG